MNIGECYQILGISSAATLAEVKSCYRRLARQYHPDVNPGNARSHEQFIQINQAYQNLTHWLEQHDPQIAVTTSPQPSENFCQTTEINTPPTSEVKTNRQSTTQTQPQTNQQTIEQPANFSHHPNLSEFDKLLKQRAYLQLQQLLKYRRFARAIALIEGLVQRIPQDTEVRQWQAITYQRMGRYLIDIGDFDKAKIYLKKSIRTDPLNRSLLSEVKREFWRLQTLGN